MGPLRVDRWRQDGGGTVRCGYVFSEVFVVLECVG